VPVFAEKARATPFHRHHIIERYGLLTIISLGEIMLAISLGFGALYGEHFSLASALTAVSALLLVFLLFWIYFCEKEHLPSSDLKVAFVWGYGHVFIFGGIAALGAGIAAELDIAQHHSQITQNDVAWWVGVPLAIVFTSIWATRDKYFNRGPRGFALPVMALASLAAAAAGLETWAFALIALIALLWRVPLREPAAD
jgi:low temperature requirement protein LtrA